MIEQVHILSQWGDPAPRLNVIQSMALANGRPGQVEYGERPSDSQRAETYLVEKMKRRSVGPRFHLHGYDCAQVRNFKLAHPGFMLTEHEFTRLREERPTRVCRTCCKLFDR